MRYLEMFREENSNIISNNSTVFVFLFCLFRFCFCFGLHAIKFSYFLYIGYLFYDLWSLATLSSPCFEEALEEMKKALSCTSTQVQTPNTQLSAAEKESTILFIFLALIILLCITPVLSGQHEACSVVFALLVHTCEHNSLSLALAHDRQCVCVCD